jgi:acyl-CoA thioesterase I
MSCRALGWAVAGVVVLGGSAVACGGSLGSAHATTTRPGASRSIVALGDSVPRGTNCNCRPYPELTADGLAATSGAPVTATNDSVAGYTTSNVLHQLETSKSVRDHIRTAGVVEIEIGANDVAYSSSCGTNVACYEKKMPALRENLAAIVRRTRRLAGVRKPLVVLLDYWSVWLGGRYAEAHGQAYVAAAEQMTDDVDSAIKSTAARSRSAYVDLRLAFKGPNYDYDETHYLSNDGDHPNAAGHEKIASATDATIKKALHL